MEAEQLAVVAAGILGGFNRSSQHVQFDWPASTGPELRREFSIRGSCGAVRFEMRKPRAFNSAWIRGAP